MEKDAMNKGFDDAAEKEDATAMYNAGLALLEKIRAVAESTFADRAAQSEKMVEKHTALCNLQVEVHMCAENAQIQYQQFQRELDTTKGLRDELVKLLEPTLKLLFPSRSEGKDLVQMAAELRRVSHWGFESPRASSTQTTREIKHPSL
uniref:DUF641 domain-containing protein n=1 Tax=Oryza punctata TaxID=4537 RepID=A0A0E0KZY9_ORYPU